MFWTLRIFLLIFCPFGGSWGRQHILLDSTKVKIYYLHSVGTVNGQLYFQLIKTVFTYVNVMCVCVLFGEKE